MTDEQKDRYFLAVGESGQWSEVTKEEYVQAERAAGFHNTLGRPDEPATAGFHSGPIRGTLCYGGEHLPEDYVPLRDEQ